MDLLNQAPMEEGETHVVVGEVVLVHTDQILVKFCVRSNVVEEIRGLVLLIGSLKSEEGITWLKLGSNVVVEAAFIFFA